MTTTTPSAPVTPTSASVPASTPQLVRPRDGRVIAGVCAGLARRFGWNVTLVRALAIVSIVLPGSQLLVYGICWIVIPNETARA